jgi:hypothetical protein
MHHVNTFLLLDSYSLRIAPWILFAQAGTAAGKRFGVAEGRGEKTGASMASISFSFAHIPIDSFPGYRRKFSISQGVGFY